MHFNWYQKQGGEVLDQNKSISLSENTLDSKGGDKEGEVANMGRNKGGMMDLGGVQVNIGW